MKIFRRVGFLLVVSLLLVLTMGGWGCAPEEVAPPEKPPAEKPPAEKPPEKPPPTIKVGLLGSRTGGAAAYGEALAGAEWVFEQANAAGGIKSMGGAKIEWVYGNTESNVDKVVGELERLVNVEKVDAIIFSSPTMEQSAGAPYFDKNRVPVLGTITTGGPLFPLNLKYWFCFSAPSDEAYGKGPINIILRGLIEEFNIKHDRIALVFCDADYIKMAKEAAIPELEAMDLMKNVVYDKLHPAKITDAMMASVALEVKASKPDVVIYNDIVANSTKNFKAFHELGFYPPVLVSGLSLIGYETFWKMLGEEMMMDLIATKAVFFTALTHPKLPYQPYQEAAAKFEPWLEAKGIALSFYHYLDMQAAYSLCRVWETIGTSDPEKVNDALHEIKIEEGDPQLVAPLFLPALEFYPNGRPVNVTPFGAQWQEHELELIFPLEVRTAEPVFPK